MKNFFDGKVKQYFNIGVAVIFVIMLFTLIIVITQSSKALTADMIIAKIESASELITAKVVYDGHVELEEGSIPFINRKGFRMEYAAEIGAGIDFSRISAEVTKDEIIVALPSIEIRNVYIIPDSIDFYDEKSALFNRISNDDVIEAIKMAEKDIEISGIIPDLKNEAAEQCEKLLLTLLYDIADGRTIKFQYKSM